MCFTKSRYSLVYIYNMFNEMLTNLVSQFRKHVEYYKFINICLRMTRNIYYKFILIRESLFLYVAIEVKNKCSQCFERKREVCTYN